MPGMRRREFITLLGSAAVAWPLAAHAQQGQRVRRIGVLMGLVASDLEAQSRVAAFEHGLRELGWVKGRNLWIEYRWAGGGENVLRNHASELIAMAPDLILANSTPVTAALREQSRVVPMVFTQVTDPVGQGLVPNLAHPGGNLTGFTSFEFSIGTKWLELLKQTAPHVTRVALVFNPHSAPFADLFVRPVGGRAPSFSVTPIAAAVRATDDLNRVFDALAREANGGLIVLSDLGMTNHRDALIALAAHHRVPAVYPFRYFVASGGLDVLRHRCGRGLSARGRLCRPYSQGHKSGRPSSASADFGGAAAEWPLVARAQQSAVPVVGLITGFSPDAAARYVAAFRKGLNQTGHVEGEDVTVEYHWLEGHYDRLPVS